MSKAAVIFWSQTGNTEQMASAIAEGIREGGMECDLLNVADTNPTDAAAYAKIALGCPAMGAEVLEETEFDPFFTDLESKLSGSVRLLRLGRRPVDARLGTAYQRRKRCHLHR